MPNDEPAAAMAVVDDVVLDAPKSRAEEVAAELSYGFFRRGSYFRSTGPTEVPGLIEAASSSPGEATRSVSGFGAISVQAVGFEDGTENPAVHVYPTAGTVRQLKALPTEIDGVKVRAHKMGPISVRPEAALTATNRGNIFERGNRICCGTSCAPTSESSVGTLGALVRMESNGELFLLSNNHVLAGCNHVPPGQPIMAPGGPDGRPGATAPKEVGRHDRIHELRTGHPGMVNPSDADVALARVTDADAVSSWQGDETNGYDTPGSTIEPLSGMGVKKFGRTTGLTQGVIEAKVATPQAIEYRAKYFRGTVWFRDVWSVAAIGDHFALGGDSGSLVVTEDGKHAIGLIFAANPTGSYGWIVPTSCVLRAFTGLELVHGHGL